MFQQINSSANCKRKKTINFSSPASERLKVQAKYVVKPVGLPHKQFAGDGECKWVKLLSKINEAFSLLKWLEISQLPQLTTNIFRARHIER